MVEMCGGELKPNMSDKELRSCLVESCCRISKVAATPEKSNVYRRLYAKYMQRREREQELRKKANELEASLDEMRTTIRQHLERIAAQDQMSFRSTLFEIQSTIEDHEHQLAMLNFQSPSYR